MSSKSDAEMLMAVGFHCYFFFYEVLILFFLTVYIVGAVVQSPKTNS